VPGETESLAEPTAPEPRGSRRPLVLAAVVLVVVLAVGGGLFAFLRSDDDEGGGEAVTEVTFTPEGNATSIPERPPTFGPVMQLSTDRGPAGAEVTLQGANFRADKEVRKVDLHWDRVDGLKLGTVDAPRFSVKVTIPADAPVLNEGHFILAIQRDDDGKLITQQSAQFYVLPG
jgi:hypothetical protein